MRNFFSLCISTPPHSPEFHVVAGLSPTHPSIFLFSLHVWRRWSLLGQYWPLQTSFTRAYHWPLRTNNVLNVLQLLCEMFWVFEKDSCCLQECSLAGTQLLFCWTVILRNRWLHYQVLFSDWEHNKTSLDKQLKHVTKKGISSSGPIWVVVFLSNLIFFSGLHFTPHPLTFTTNRCVVFR